MVTDQLSLLDVVGLPVLRPGDKEAVSVATNPVEVGPVLDLRPDTKPVYLHVAWLPSGSTVEGGTSSELNHGNYSVCGVPISPVGNSCLGVCTLESA